MYLYQLQYNKELEIANNEGSSREKRAQLSKGDREEVCILFYLEV